MPRRILVDSLKSMCIDNICKNMESFWYEKYWKDIYSSPERVLREVGPFEYLPGSIVNEITEKCVHNHWCFDSTVSSLITSTLVKWVLVNPRLGSHMMSGPLVFHLISLKCQDTLKELILPKCRFENEDLMKAIKSLRKLEVLNLEYTDINDEVLGVVGAHSSELRKLSLMHCKYVTDKGMEYLLVDESSVNVVNGYGKCKQIESLNIRDTEVGVSGIETVLRNAPKLQNLDHPCVALALGRLHCKDLESELPLYSLTTLHGEYHAENLYSNESLIPLLSIATRVCPHVTEVFLGIDRCIQERAVLRPLCQLSHLKNMDIQCFGWGRLDFAFSEVVPVLSVSGQSITRLHLKGFPWVDVGIIGVCCPLLEDLYLNVYDNHAVKESREVLDPATDRKPFAFLKFLNICLGISYHGRRKDCITQLQLKEMLSSRHLESITIKGSSSLTDSLLSDVIKAGQEFPNLRKLYLFMCPYITALFVQSLLNLPNPLEEISVERCKKINRADFYSLKSFCKENGFNVSMSLSG